MSIGWVEAYNGAADVTANVGPGGVRNAETFQRRGSDRGIDLTGQ